MKVLLLVSFILLTLSRESCKSKKEDNAETTAQDCYKGKLEVKGGCMNYTIGITTKNFDTSMVVATWKDEMTGKTYTNVFALGSRCTFPDTINEGDEFYFRIDSTSVQNCMVCLMYYPVPAKKLSIKVLAGPCK